MFKVGQCLLTRQLYIQTVFCTHDGWYPRAEKCGYDRCGIAVHPALKPYGPRSNEAMYARINGSIFPAHGPGSDTWRIYIPITAGIHYILGLDLVEAPANPSAIFKYLHDCVQSNSPILHKALLNEFIKYLYVRDREVWVYQHGSEIKANSNNATGLCVRILSQQLPSRFFFYSAQTGHVRHYKDSLP